MADGFDGADRAGRAGLCPIMTYSTLDAAYLDTAPISISQRAKQKSPTRQSLLEIEPIVPRSALPLGTKNVSNNIA
jgi:hypothetical protein